MPFIYQMISLRTRHAPAEVEQRLRRIVRKPRTWREILRRKPLNPPDNPSFIGTVAEGRFKISRIELVPGDMSAWTESLQPTVRGSINSDAQGTEIKLLFCDLGLSFIAIGMGIVTSGVILANTRAWPFWRLEHGLLLLVIVTVLWACHYSLSRNIQKSMAIIASCLR